MAAYKKHKHETVGKFYLIRENFGTWEQKDYKYVVSANCSHPDYVRNIQFTLPLIYGHDTFDGINHKEWTGPGLSEICVCETLERNVLMDEEISKEEFFKGLDEFVSQLKDMISKCESSSFERFAEENYGEMLSL